VSADVLVLSGSIGHGHDSVAEACADAFGACGQQATVRDCMALLGGVRQRVADAVFRSMLGTAPLYDAFHFSGLRAGAPFVVRSAERATVHLLDALGDQLADPSLTTVISVFALGAAVIGRTRQRRGDLRGVVVVSDATAHRLWVHEGVGRYVVFSEMAAGSVRQYDPRADVVMVDPPVRAEFLDAPPRAQAREALGQPEDRPIVLLMGGGWGRGPLMDVAHRLQAKGLLPIVLAGSNRRLMRQVTGPRCQADGPIVLGRTHRVARLMAAADVVVTSPGQACHEARAVGRPLVVTDTVPGHGRENLLGELAKGGAIASTPQPDRIEAAVLAALDGIAGEATPGQPVEWGKQLVAAATLP
jgi:processive 1,2-diacylglycerol beta-glucosyltransferase